MIISKLEISLFKSIKHVAVDFKNFTPVLGANNAGKSTILRAIDIFFDAAPKIERHDHYRSDTSAPILITVTFSSLTPTELETFDGSVIDDKITITREVSCHDRHGGYAIYRKSHPAFQDFYNQGSKTEKRKMYTELRPIFNLPVAQNAEECEAHLLAYEAEHQDELVPTRIKGFLGAVNVANGVIKRKTSYVVVPAVKDGGDLDAERTSPVVSLLNAITKQTLENKLDLQEYLAEARSKIEGLANPEDEPKLNAISADITSILKNYYSDAAVEASWDKSDLVQINYPRALLSVSHRGIDLPVQSLGHGLQRILIFAVLQYLARNQNLADQEAAGSASEFAQPLSDIIIAIEEPEIYQHPIKQRQIYNNIRLLSDSFDKATGIRIQIIFTTHSEKMVALGDFDSLRLLRKKEAEEEYETLCSTCRIEDCSKELAEMQDPPVPPYSKEKFLASLHIFTDEISEGFFADKVILVEGVSDKAILSAAYITRGRSADDDGIAIIRTDGKTKLDKPALILKKFAMPVFLVFDSDKKGVNNARINKLLQKISGVADPVDYPEGCAPSYCAFKGNLNEYIDLCLADKKDKLYAQVCESWNLTSSEVAKSPNVVASLFTLAKDAGIEFPIVDQIIESVDAL